ncbi:hypothetical protein Rhopal_001507-T1 [Rhodotorula paludigena]|uniref:Uncharacterized protein n=1 Tax=Rhodotorula paludigena TaxID=86838 RepID=A0AAV5GFZ3_9BASI|nr:hypothetical protein Rhopal_001507-T1 [Rhodotorula paludigena]
MEDAPLALLASKPRPYNANCHLTSLLSDLCLAPGAPSAYEPAAYKSSQGDVYAASAQLLERTRPPSKEESSLLRHLQAVQLMEGDYITDTMNALTALCANADRVGPTQADASPLPPLQRPDPSSPLAMPSLLYRYANEEGLRVALWSMLALRLCAFLLAVLGRPVLLHVPRDAFAASSLALAFENLEQPRLLIEIKTEAALSRKDMQALIENAARGIRMVMPEFDDRGSITNTETWGACRDGRKLGSEDGWDKSLNWILLQLALGKDRASELSSDQRRRLVLLLTNGSSWLVYAEIDGTGLFAPYLLSSTEHCIVALIAALFLATVLERDRVDQVEQGPPAKKRKTVDADDKLFLSFNRFPHPEPVPELVSASNVLLRIKRGSKTLHDRDSVNPARGSVLPLDFQLIGLMRLSTKLTYHSSDNRFVLSMVPTSYDDSDEILADLQRELHDCGVAHGDIHRSNLRIVGDLASPSPQTIALTSSSVSSPSQNGSPTPQEAANLAFIDFGRSVLQDDISPYEWREARARDWAALEKTFAFGGVAS